MDPAPGSSLGSATLIERLGRGGMGEVWLGERVAPGGVRRRVAVKRLLTQYQSTPALRERFIAEARITARLEHPNVVQLIEFGDAPELFLVLEYVPGVSLDALLRRAAASDAPVPLPAALYIASEAAEGLDYAHRLVDERGAPLGVVHRDVSPQNVLVSLEGAVKVTDFGVARAADNVLRTRAGVGIGKPAYMAPEQALGGPLDRRADVFALGVVLWETLTLRSLLPRDSPAAAAEARMRGAFPPPSRYAPHVPPALDALVLEAIAPDPAARTASAGRMAAALRAMLHALAPGYGPRELARYVAALFPERAARGSTAPMTVGMPVTSMPPPPPGGVSTSLPPPLAHASLPPAAPARNAPGVAQTAALAAMPVPGSMHVTAPPPAVHTQPAAPSFAAAPLPPTPARAASHAPLVAALAAGVLVALLAIGGVGFVLLRRASARPESAVSAAPAGGGLFARAFAPYTNTPVAREAAYRPALTQMLAGMARGCAGMHAAHAPVGAPRVVTADLALGNGGAIQRYVVRVQGTAADAAVGACVEDMLRRMPALGPYASDLNLAGLATPF